MKFREIGRCNATQCIDVNACRTLIPRLISTLIIQRSLNDWMTMKRIEKWSISHSISFCCSHIFFLKNWRNRFDPIGICTYVINEKPIISVQRMFTIIVQYVSNGFCCFSALFLSLRVWACSSCILSHSRTLSITLLQFKMLKTLTAPIQPALRD